MKPDWINRVGKKETEDLFQKHADRIIWNAGCVDADIQTTVMINGTLRMLPFGTQEEWSELNEGLTEFLEGRPERYEKAVFELMRPYDKSCLTIFFHFAVLDKDGRVINFPNMRMDYVQGVAGHNSLRETRNEFRLKLANYFGVPIKNVLPLTKDEFDAMEMELDLSLDITPTEVHEIFNNGKLDVARLGESDLM